MYNSSVTYPLFWLILILLVLVGIRYYIRVYREGEDEQRKALANHAKELAEREATRKQKRERELQEMVEARKKADLGAHLYKIRYTSKLGEKAKAMAERERKRAIVENFLSAVKTSITHDIKHGRFPASIKISEEVLEICTHTTWAKPGFYGFPEEGNDFFYSFSLLGKWADEHHIPIRMDLEKLEIFVEDRDFGDYGDLYRSKAKGRLTYA